MDYRPALSSIVIFSYGGLTILAFIKTFKHLKYQRLKRGEKHRGFLLNILHFTPNLFIDYFVSFFLFPILKKCANPDLEKLRLKINQMVFAIYICILLLSACLIISRNFKLR